MNRQGWISYQHEEEGTKGGVLAKRLQEADARLGSMTSYRVRVVESAGTAMSRLLPSTNP